MTAKDNIDFQKLDFINNNHCIVYAPNSTGKTRLTTKLSKKYVNEQAVFFTSSAINDMLSFSGRKIYVGSDSSFKLENDNIIKEFNKNVFGDYILKAYDVKNASSLTKSSYLFNFLNLKRKDTFEIYSKLFDFLKGDEFISKEFEFSEMVQIDKMLSKLNLDDIKRIVSNNIKLTIDDNEYLITAELKEKLQSICNSINSSKRVCPLCGHEFDTNKELKSSINNVLEKYVVTSGARDYEVCINFLNILNNINNFLGIDYFATEHNNEIHASLLLDNLNIIDSFLRSYASYIVRKINEQTSKELFIRYKENETNINKEDGLRKDNLHFYESVVVVLNELITLPDGFVFRAKKDRVEIIDASGKTVDPNTFLSESERRRMCLSIVFAEVKQKQLQYIVFDDPVDSNDDYYFDVSVNTIGDLLLANKTLNWLILTHEFRMISILSERCRLLDDEFSKDISFLFYLPDPSFGKTTTPPFSLIRAKAESISFLNEHETIIFRKIFLGRIGYRCDKDLALLSSFNTARNLYNDIIKNHRISKHEHQKLAKAITTGNKSYEHYKSGNKSIMRLSTLFIMNKTMYELSIDPSYFTNSKLYAANYREKFLTTKTYGSISCDSDVLKYILYAMIRVMNSHYQFEKKMAKWAFLNIPLFSYSKFENTLMIYNKLKYIESICPTSKKGDFKRFNDCFVKWRGLLNDFAHSTSRMVPPYLTISPIEMSKLEASIKRLP